MKIIFWAKELAGKALYHLFRRYFEGVQDRTIRTRCLLWCEGEILLVRNTVGQQRWTLPGGGIKTRETPLAAVKRELKEELELVPKQVLYLGIVETARGRRYHCFSARVPNKRYRLHPLELLDARWVKPGEWPDNLSPIVELALAESTEVKGTV